MQQWLYALVEVNTNHTNRNTLELSLVVVCENCIHIQYWLHLIMYYGYKSSCLFSNANHFLFCKVFTDENELE